MRRTLELHVTGVLSQIIPSSWPHVKSSKKDHQSTNKVIRLPVQRRHLWATVLLFLFVSSSVAYPNPRIESPKGRRPGAIYFRTDCRPLTEEELQKRMGPHFDSSRMASSASGLRLGQPSDAIHDGDFSDEDVDDVQGDDPDAFADMMYDEDDDDDDEQGGDDMDEEEFLEDSDETDDVSDKSQRYKYMRRRRGVSKEDVPQRAAAVAKRRSDTLHLRLGLSGRKTKGHRSHEPKSRKQLKKELREKVRKSNKDPPWECKMQPEYKKMRPGIFPRYVTDGKCVTDKCYFRIYNCVPKKYNIILLERDPDRCNPVPLIGTNTTYEEKWYYRNYFVTVGCNCERRKPKKRRRH